MYIIGHRGARGLAPENTLTGIKAGIKAGADWVEFDVRATRDGRVIVAHDASTLRISSHFKLIKTTTFRTLRQLKIFDHYTIPTLAEALNAVDGRAKVNIEVKSAGCAEAVVHNIVRHIKKGARYNDFLVSSFNPIYLKQVHKLNPQIHLGLLHLTRPFKFMRIRGLRVQAVGFHHRRLPRRAVQQAKLRGLSIYAYTVNSPALAAKLLTKGVDGLVTDRPDILRAKSS